MKSREDGIMMASGVPVAVCHIIMMHGRMGAWQCAKNRIWRIILSEDGYRYTGLVC